MNGCCYIYIAFFFYNSFFGYYTKLEGRKKKPPIIIHYPVILAKIIWSNDLPAKIWYSAVSSFKFGLGTCFWC